METWEFLQSPTASAAWNMALDEALLRTAADRSRPLLRVYAWDKPAVSFGYFQKYPAHLAADWVLVRRPTGGGVVYHRDDTTYTVVVPPGHPLYQMTTREAYCALHQAVAASFNFESEILNLQSTVRGTYECFQNPVAGDVLADGRKLAGGAQRRGRTGMLHQGSIAARVTVEQLVRGFGQQFAADFHPVALSATAQSLAEKLARDKYATAAWNQRVQ